MFRRKFSDLKQNVSVSSAGLGALVGYGADPNVISILAEHGIDASDHKARQITVDDLSRNELILVMENWQIREIEKFVPTAKGKVHLLGRWQGIEIADPYKKPRVQFERTYELIESTLADWIEKIWHG